MEITIRKGVKEDLDCVLELIKELTITKINLMR